MKVIKEEKADVLQSVTFEAEPSENTTAFRAAIKTWIHDKYPAATIEDFWDRLVRFEANRVKISML